MLNIGVLCLIGNPDVMPFLNQTTTNVGSLPDRVSRESYKKVRHWKTNDEAIPSAHEEELGATGCFVQHLKHE
jgi:hypothetical protein